MTSQNLDVESLTLNVTVFRQSLSESHSASLQPHAVWWKKLDKSGALTEGRIRRCSLRGRESNVGGVSVLADVIKPRTGARTQGKDRPYSGQGAIATSPITSHLQDSIVGEFSRDEGTLPSL